MPTKRLRSRKRPVRKTYYKASPHASYIRIHDLSITFYKYAYIIYFRVNLGA